jgi:hypothetical protein
MNLSIKQAAEVLGKTRDELMFYVQTNKIQASVDQDTMAWMFDLNEVLQLKKNLEEDLTESKQLLVE